MKNKQRSKSTRAFEHLERRRVMTAIGFVSHELSPPDPSPEHFIPADIDGDGDIDVVSDLGDQLVWFENTDSLGGFSDPKLISARYGVNFELTDLNGDGNTDILSGSKWLQGRGDGTFDSLATLPIDTAISYSADFDGDGDLDILTHDIENSILRWLDNTDGIGNFEPRDSMQLPGGDTILLADLNSDALVDIIVPFENGAIWLPSSKNDGPFSSQTTLELTEDRVQKLLVTDWDLDGDTDLISLSTHVDGSSIQLHENDGMGTLGLGEGLPGANNIYPIDFHIGDVDQDGDPDIVYEWNHFNLPGLGATSWIENAAMDSTKETTGLLPHANDSYLGDLALADVNGDKQFDAVFNGQSRGLAWMNTSVRDRNPFSSIVSPVDIGAHRTGFEDVDGDGDQDITWTNRDESRRGWFPRDQDGTFGKSQELDNNVALPFVDDRIYADLDNDGDLDVVNRFGGTVWYEFDGQAYQEVDIEGLSDEPFRHQVVDQDGDGDADLVALSNGSVPGLTKLSWFENVDGHGSFGTEHVVTETERITSFYQVDVNSDGDYDALVDSSSARGTIWFEYLDDGSFSEGKSTTSIMGFVKDLALADADDDGLAERVIALNDDTITWERELPTKIPLLQRFGGRAGVDLDADGDIDLLMLTFGRLHWQENVDGKLMRHVGTNSPIGLLIEDRYAFRWSLGDVDDDGDLDVVSAGFGKVAWHENRLVGDADDDGEVGFDDFLALSANFGAIDAAWEDGDFTGDGEVSFEDFLALSANFGQSRFPKP